MIGNSVVIGIEGAHGSGKTTTAMLLCAALKQRHLNVGLVSDVARTSPFIVDETTNDITTLLHTQLHLAALQIASELECSRSYDIMICDKTLVGILAYTKLLIDPTNLSTMESSIFDAFITFCTQYFHYYDLILRTSRLYDANKTRDVLRPTNPNYQQQAHHTIAELLDSLPGNIKILPDLTNNATLDFVLSNIATTIQNASHGGLI